MTVEWRTKATWNTGYSADSVEWCPVEPYKDVLVCGTYQLKQEDQPQTIQKRLGKLYLFVIKGDTTELTPIQTLETSGILDQKWCYHLIQDYAVLALVTSEGFLHLYRLVEKEEELSLELWAEESIGQNILALSLDWSTNKTASEEARLIVSDSSGRVILFELVGGKLKNVGEWKGHEFEAWIAAFDYWNPDVFFSGGDDCIFKKYDVRVSEAAVMSNRSHEAGVTAVRSHIDVEHQLLTGSYDERVRLWDIRNFKRCITEADSGGGIWRLKWHPYKPDTILAACMYGGFRILKQQENNNMLSVVSEYMCHESIAYGADWKSDNGSCLIATCSFYDCKMDLSEVLE